MQTTINGKVVPDYATVQGILIGVVAAFVVIVTIIGPENHGSRFEKHKTAFEVGGGRDEAVIEDSDSVVAGSSIREEKGKRSMDEVRNV